MSKGGGEVPIPSGNVKFISMNNIIQNKKSYEKGNKHIKPSGDNDISKLEEKKKELQEQQSKELEKIKQQKAQIIKLHNRKKEIELMNNIALEQNKLQLIQQKQQELNNIMTKQLNVSTTTKNTNINNNSNLIINNSKRTKKNEEAIVQNIKINSNKPPEIIKKTKVDNADRIILEDEKKEPTKKEVSKKEEVPIKTTEPIKTEEPKKKEQKKENKKESNEPYKYYSKKEKTDVIWPSKSELYNSETYQNNLIICNGFQPFLKKNESQKKNYNIDDIKKELKNEYNIKKIDRFNDNAINIIYYILKYDKIYLKE